MKRRFFGRRVLSMFLVSVVLLASLISGAGAAANGVQQIYIRSIACEADAGGDLLYGSTYPPAGCAPFAGVTVRALTIDGRSVGSCTSDEDGGCGISGEFGIRLVLIAENWPLSSVYTPLANPVFYTPEPRAVGDVIMFVRTDSLPRTRAATLTVHARQCPTGYQGIDWYADCHESPPEYPMAVLAASATFRSSWTDDQGDARFELPVWGEWTLALALPETIAGYEAFCARADAPGKEIPSETVTGASNGPPTSLTRVFVEEGADVVCDLYILPGDATGNAQITFHPRLCRPLLPADQIFSGCHDNTVPGGYYELHAIVSGGLTSGLLDEEGNLIVSVPPGRYGLQFVQGHIAGERYVYCSLDSDRQIAFEESPFVRAGEAWTCDIYQSYEIYR